jgi:hypothetical protein
MTTTSMSRDRFWSRMRWVVWGAAAGLLLLPAIAMRYTTEVNWDGADFIVMGLMLGAVCGVFEVGLRMARSHAYVVATGIAAGAGFLLTWVNLAVGIIGNEDNPLNLIFVGVLLVGLFGALIARLQPRGMARAMQATAVAQLLACVVALLVDGAYVFVLTAVWVGLWLISAQLFHKAARDEAQAAG